MENLFLASIEIGTFARTGDERAIKGRRNRQEYYLGYHRHHLLVLIPFLSPFPSTLLWREREGEKKESSDGAVVVGQRRYSKCERMQISSLMSGIFKEAERWMEHAAGTGQYDDICIWYIIQSPFLPPTTAACAAHKPPCRSHEIRLPGKSPFFLSLSFYTSSHTFDSDEILLFLRIRILSIPCISNHTVRCFVTKIIGSFFSFKFFSLFLSRDRYRETQYM